MVFDSHTNSFALQVIAQFVEGNGQRLVKRVGNPVRCQDVVFGVGEIVFSEYPNHLRAQDLCNVDRLHDLSGAILGDVTCEADHGPTSQRGHFHAGRRCQFLHLVEFPGGGVQRNPVLGFAFIEPSSVNLDRRRANPATSLEKFRKAVLPEAVGCVPESDRGCCICHRQTPQKLKSMSLEDTRF